MTGFSLEQPEVSPSVDAGSVGERKLANSKASWVNGKEYRGWWRKTGGRVTSTAFSDVN